jgi:hypothetical protein
MKTKKPSLLDMECFVQARTRSSQLIKDEPDMPNPSAESFQASEQSAVEPDIQIPLNDRLSDDTLTTQAIQPPSEKNDAQTDEPVQESQPETSDQPETSNADVLQVIKMMLSDYAPNNEYMKEVLNMVTEQKAEILYLKNEMNRLKSQVEAFNIIADQKIEIKYLRDKVTMLQNMFDQFAGKKHDRPAPRVQAPVDEHYKTLIFRNIVKMKDENGFSSLDVAKLFKREGFAIFSPYAAWDEDTVTHMYKFAKTMKLP